MPLNLPRHIMQRSAEEAARHTTPFQAEADAALARFQAVRSELERNVRRGDLTVKAAREQAAIAASELRTQLFTTSEGYSPVPRAFLDRLIAAGQARAKARENQSIEGLQRETNRLLRQALIEQQMETRAVEF